MLNIEQISQKTPEKKKAKFIEVKTQYGEKEKKVESKLVYAAETVASEEHPRVNQDYFFADPNRHIAGMFDGMGGEAGGEIASREAGDVVNTELHKIKPGTSVEEIRSAIKSALKAADQKVKEHADMLPYLEGMGTTASVLKIVESGGERHLVFGQVGDSRISIVHVDGSLEQITIDDGILKEAVARGWITKEDAEVIDQAEKKEDVAGIKSKGLSAQKLFEMRNRIMQAVGMWNIKPTTGVYKLKDGDIPLVTSDGIHDNLTAKEMAEIVRNTYLDGPKAIAEALKSAAAERAHLKFIQDPNMPLRAKVDDISVLAFAEEIPQLMDKDLGL